MIISLSCQGEIPADARCASTSSTGKRGWNEEGMTLGRRLQADRMQEKDGMAETIESPVGCRLCRRRRPASATLGAAGRDGGKTCRIVCKLLRGLAFDAASQAMVVSTCRLANRSNGAAVQIARLGLAGLLRIRQSMPCVRKRFPPTILVFVRDAWGRCRLMTWIAP